MTLLKVPRGACLEDPASPHAWRHAGPMPSFSVSMSGECCPSSRRFPPASCRRHAGSQPWIVRCCPTFSFFANEALSLLQFASKPETGRGAPFEAAATVGALCTFLLFLSFAWSTIGP